MPGGPDLRPNLSFGQESKANPQTWELLPAFGLRLEGLTLKLQNPLLDVDVR
jgi:hypothetical protein